MDGIFYQSVYERLALNKTDPALDLISFMRSNRNGST